MGSSVIPPLPPGFSLDEGTPPLPPGFVLDGEKKESRKDAPKPIESTLRGMVTPIEGFNQMVWDALPGEFPKRMSEVIKAREKDYQDRRGKDAGLDVFRLGGEIANPATMLTPAAAATTGGRVAQGALMGLLFGMNRPTQSPEERLGDGVAGAVGGAVIPGGWELAKMVGRGARNVTQGIFSPEKAAGRIANEIAGPRRDEVISSLMDAELGQTAKQAAVPSGSAEFAGLVELASKRNPSDALAVEKAQQAARSKALKDAGGNDTAIDLARADRDMAATQLFGDANKAIIKADPDLAQIASNPYFKDAVPEALKVMKARKSSPQNLTEFLQVVKFGLDRKLDRVGDDALDEAAKREVAKLKSDMVGWLEKKNPAFEKAQRQFAADSIPVNRGEVLKTLEEKTRNALDVKEAPNTFARSLKDPQKLIEEATGRNYGSLEKLMDPKQLEVINAIVKQYQTDALGKELANAGTNAAARKIGDLSHIQGTGMLNRYVTLGTSALRGMASGATDKAINKVAELSLNPQKFAEVMRKAKPYERQEIVDALMMLNARASGITYGNEE